MVDPSFFVICFPLLSSAFSRVNAPGKKTPRPIEVNTCVQRDKDEKERITDRVDYADTESMVGSVNLSPTKEI